MIRSSTSKNLKQTILNVVLGIVVQCYGIGLPSEAKKVSSLYQFKCSMPTITRD